MSALEDCCITCPACSRPVCFDLDEGCQHDARVCRWCCPSEHGEDAA